MGAQSGMEPTGGAEGATPVAPGSPVGPVTHQPESAERVGLTLQAAMDSVRQSGASSEAVAMETAYRLIQTMSAWLETLVQRRTALQTELTAREAELTALKEQIQHERAGADVLATAAQRWADEIQLGVSRKRTALEEESREMGRQAQAVTESIQHLLEGLSTNARQLHPVETSTIEDGTLAQLHASNPRTDHPQADQAPSAPVTSS